MPASRRIAAYLNVAIVLWSCGLILDCPFVGSETPIHPVRFHMRTLSLRGGERPSSEENYEHSQLDEPELIRQSFSKGSKQKDASFTLVGVNEDKEFRPAAEMVATSKKRTRRASELNLLAQSWKAELESQNNPSVIEDNRECKASVWVIAGRKHKISFFGSKSVIRWNPISLSWDEMPMLKYERVNCAAVQLGRKIYVAGGWHTTLNAMREVEVLDLDNTTNMGKGQDGCWEWSPPMAKNRSAFGMAVLNGTIYAAGGWDEETQVRRSVEKWRPGMTKWEKCASMKQERMHFGLAAIGGRLVAAGGQEESGLMLNTVEVYDPLEDRWTTLPERMYHVRMAFALVPHRDKLYAVGGFDHQGPPYVPKDLIDPETGKEIEPGWYAKHNMANPPIEATKEDDMSLLKNFFEPYVGKSVEVFDPTTGDWTELDSSLVCGRAQFSACSFNDTIVALGGLDDNGGFNNEPTIYNMTERINTPHLRPPGFQRTVEQFDMHTDAWKVADDMLLVDRRSDFACLCA